MAMPQGMQPQTANEKPSEETVKEGDAASTKAESQKTTSRPVHTTRSGSIGASIWKNNDSYGITLSRAWKPEGKDFRHSKTFYSNNRQDLHQAIDAACDYIEALTDSAKRSNENSE